jgi:hypothetical protein
MSTFTPDLTWFAYFPEGGGTFVPRIQEVLNVGVKAIIKALKCLSKPRSRFCALRYVGAHLQTGGFSFPLSFQIQTLMKTPIS